MSGRSQSEADGEEDRAREREAESDPHVLTRTYRTTGWRETKEAVRGGGDRVVSLSLSRSFFATALFCSISWCSYSPYVCADLHHCCTAKRRVVVPLTSPVCTFGSSKRPDKRRAEVSWSDRPCQSHRLFCCFATTVVF